MSTSVYQYVADDGTVYGLSLPDDLAVPLGYVPATGDEPYLPAYINPRYATYLSAPEGLYLQAFISQRYSAFVPPSSIVVGLLVYEIQSIYGEIRGSVVPSSLILAAGPQGPRGFPGQDAGLFRERRLLTSAEIMSLSSTPIALVLATDNDEIVVPEAAFFTLYYHTTAYDNDQAVQLQMGDNVWIQTASGLMLSTDDAYDREVASTGYLNTPIVDGTLYLTADQDNTSGDGDLMVDVLYRRCARGQD